MYQTALYLNNVNSYLATIHREIPLNATVRFLRNLETSSIQLLGGLCSEKPIF